MWTLVAGVCEPKTHGGKKIIIIPSSSCGIYNPVDSEDRPCQIEDFWSPQKIYGFHQHIRYRFYNLCTWRNRTEMSSLESRKASKRASEQLASDGR